MKKPNATEKVNQDFSIDKHFAALQVPSKSPFELKFSSDF